MIHRVLESLDSQSWFSAPLIPILSGPLKSHRTEHAELSSMNPEYSGPPESGVMEMSEVSIVTRIVEKTPVSDPTDSDDCSAVTPDVSNPPKTASTDSGRHDSDYLEYSFPWSLRTDYGLFLPPYRFFYISVL